jgi:hypothetical protein
MLTLFPDWNKGFDRICNTFNFQHESGFEPAIEEGDIPTLHQCNRSEVCSRVLWS